MRITLLVLLVVTVASAQEALLVREDMKDGRKPSTTVAFISPEIDIWAYSVQTYPIFAIGAGKGFELADGVRVSPHLLYHLHPQQLFFEPVFLGSWRMGEVALTGNLMPSLPLNGGSWTLYSTNLSMMAPVGEGIRVGPAGTFSWSEGSAPRGGVGVAAVWSLGDHGRVGVRALYGLGGEPDSVRLEFTYF